MTRDKILDYLNSHKNELYDKYGVIKIGLFGSYARNDYTESSDIDLAIEIIKERKSLHSFLAFKREMEAAFNKKVDVGIESTLKSLIKDQVKKEIIYV